MTWNGKAACWIVFLSGIWVPSLHGGEAPSLMDLGFEQLMDMEVSTAARKEQPLSQTPAAAYVITNEDIRRSGADSIPEVLRLAPGVSVARISPSKWSVSIRGFSGRFSNKLLVLIDGRSIYTPGFSGVYWEIHDLPLTDVERIEVIRGPGATLWGANAVNGIVNIITRHASSTHGGLAELTGGTDQGVGSLRWGGALSELADLRLYAKATRRDGYDSIGGGELDNGYDRWQIGFRGDWSDGGIDQYTLQGDLIRLDQGQEQVLPNPLNPPGFANRIRDRVDVDAGNLLVRWERSLAADSEIRIQAYWDYYRREEFTRNEKFSTLDLDLQYRFSLAGRHDIIWGLGYRLSDDDIDSDPDSPVQVEDSSRQLQTFSGFIQDEYELVNDSLWLTLGSKVEHNDFTGWELQPNLRVLWTPDEDQTLWASISRAVRTPSRGERDGVIDHSVQPPFSANNPSPLPVNLRIVGDSEYGSERLVAYEAGYRVRLARELTLDTSLFYNDYDHLLTSRLGAPTFSGTYLDLPAFTDNAMQGSIRGAELTLDWRPGPDWRLQPTLSVVRADFQLNQSSKTVTDAAVAFREQSYPEFQFSLRAGWSPRPELDLDLWLRSASAMPSLFLASGGIGLPEVESYVTLDARVAWRPYQHLELALVGRNLLDEGQLEYLEELYPVPSEVPRSFLATLRYAF